MGSFGHIKALKHNKVANHRSELLNLIKQTKLFNIRDCHLSNLLIFLWCIPENQEFKIYKQSWEEKHHSHVLLPHFQDILLAKRCLCLCAVCVRVHTWISFCSWEGHRSCSKDWKVRIGDARRCGCFTCKRFLCINIKVFKVKSPFTVPPPPKQICSLNSPTAHTHEHDQKLSVFSILALKKLNCTYIYLNM